MHTCDQVERFPRLHALRYHGHRRGAPVDTLGWLTSGRDGERHLWQRRFSSFVLDERYLLTAAPLRRAQLRACGIGQLDPDSIGRSSTAAHRRRSGDALVQVRPLLQLAPDWRRFLTRVIREEDLKLRRAHEHTGRPLGGDAFLQSLEQDLGRIALNQSRARTDPARIEYRVPGAHKQFSGSLESPGESQHHPPPLGCLGMSPRVLELLERMENGTRC